MEWLEKLQNFPQLIQEEPRYGFVAIATLFVWLIGVICEWKWTYSRSGSTGGNSWLNLLGPKTYRLGVEVILAVMIGVLLYLFSVTGK